MNAGDYEQRTKFCEVFGQLFNKAGTSLYTVSRRAAIDPAYLHRLRLGTKSNPSRDVVLRLAIALQLSLEETDELLFAAGLAPLVPP